MDVLIVEPLDPEVMQWLVARHSVRFAPELSDSPLELRKALHTARTMIVPASVALDGDALINAPMLCAVGRLSAGSENIDLDACARMNIEVVRPVNASAAAEADSPSAPYYNCCNVFRWKTPRACWWGANWVAAPWA
ncbi:MAG: hypothetical protein IPP44_24240 [Ideonella sp.]|nr:hypothetical protein [Ideonella sp.]